MPIFDSFHYQNSEILVWKMEETEEELLLLAETRNKNDAWKGNR